MSEEKDNGRFPMTINGIDVKPEMWDPFNVISFGGSEKKGSFFRRERCFFA